VSEDVDERTHTSPTPVWRILAGGIVLAALGSVGLLLIPVYLHNLQLVRSLHAAPPASESATRQFVLDRGRALGLEIAPNQLQIRRLPGTRAAEIRYVVRVSIPVYTVDLHFSSTVSDVR
jgi:hypothetical protein